MMNENHPAWRAYNLHRNQFSYTNDTRRKPYDQDEDTINQDLVRTIKQYSHDMGMVKDLLVVIMNLLEKHGDILEEHSEILDETSDMLDLIITFNSDEE
jgi:hypothetical protein